jgi:hypothetical protein
VEGARPAPQLAASAGGLKMEPCISMVLGVPYEIVRAATSDFSTVHHISSGGFGSVYGGTLAGSISGDYVFKVDHHSKLSLATAITSFEHEKVVASQCHHPNVTALAAVSYPPAAVGQPLHAPVLIYRRMHGSLASILDKDVLFMWSEFVELARGAARGLSYLHSGMPGLTIVHWDVKPSNILWSHTDNSVVGTIADLGLAILQSSEEARKGGFRGTPGYYCQVDIVSTPRADVYAYGATFLQLLLRDSIREAVLPQYDGLAAVAGQQCTFTTCCRFRWCGSRGHRRFCCCVPPVFEGRLQGHALYGSSS